MDRPVFVENEFNTASAPTQSDAAVMMAEDGRLVIRPRPHPELRPLKRVLVFPLVVLCLLLLAEHYVPADGWLWVFLGAYSLYALIEALVSRRLQQCSKPVQVVFAGRQVTVSEHAFWQRSLRQTHHDVADYVAVASYWVPAAVTAYGIGGLRTVLLPQKGYLNPLLMDWHGNGGSLARMSSADEAAAAELRARIAAATGLPDAGFLGQCREEEVWLRYRHQPAA